jgi:hypothetical protein
VQCNAHQQWQAASAFGSHHYCCVNDSISVAVLPPLVSNNHGLSVTAAPTQASAPHTCQQSVTACSITTADENPKPKTLSLNKPAWTAAARSRCLQQWLIMTSQQWLIMTSQQWLIMTSQQWLIMTCQQWLIQPGKATHSFGHSRLAIGGRISTTKDDLSTVQHALVLHLYNDCPRNMDA